MALVTIFSIAILFTICLLPYILSQKPHGSSCTNSIQCQTNYCRAERCIDFGDVSDDVGDNPCATVFCGSPTVCVLQEVQCIRFPCLPIASCERPLNHHIC